MGTTSAVSSEPEVLHSFSIGSLYLLLRWPENGGPALLDPGVSWEWGCPWEVSAVGGRGPPEAPCALSTALPGRTLR